MDLQLIRQAFLPGEVISGRLTLQLEEPTRSSRLVVGIHGTHQDRTRYRVERQLAGKGIYLGGSYDFRLQLPLVEGLSWRVYAALDGIAAAAEITVGND